MTRGTLYVITSATGAAQHLDRLVGPAVADGWDPWIVGTPQSRSFLDLPCLEEITGNPVEFEYRRPGERRKRPPADALIVGGASFNTINKWALGIADNLATSLLCELPSYDIPVAVLPFVNLAMSKHPAYWRNIDVIKGIGATVIAGNGVNEPHPPHMGKVYVQSYPWQQALDVVKARK